MIARWLALYWGVWLVVALIGESAGADGARVAFWRWYPPLLLPIFYAMLYKYFPHGGGGFGRCAGRAGEGAVSGAGEAPRPPL